MGHTGYADCLLTESGWNTKEKLYKTNAAIWHNKIWREKQLAPNCISIKINGKNSQCRKTTKASTHYRLNQELKFLYVKKQKLNERLYRIYLECATSWQNSWHIIQSSTDNKLQRQMSSILIPLASSQHNLYDLYLLLCVQC